jgi:hypothetical protein
MSNEHSSKALMLAVPFCLTLAACGVDASSETEADPALAVLDQALDTADIDDVVARVADLTVRVPKAFNVPYVGMASAEFPNGLPVSIGSGLRFKRGAGPWPTFYGLSDRGPNGDSPDYLDAGGATHPTKSFLTPNFSPQLVKIELLPFLGPTVTQTIPFRANHARVSGIPLIGHSPEVALSESLVAYPASATGVDSEGIDFDARGDAWICDEYGPSLFRVRVRTGEIQERLLPGSGLPAVISSRQASRGFEGVAVTPNGKVYGLIQSTLDIAGSTKSKAQFIRIVEYDPKTQATRMFAYPHDVAAYAKSGDAKLGDLVALDNSRFLLIEQGKDKDKKLRNIVYAISLEGATDLSGLTLSGGANAGLELEYGTAAEIAAQIVPVKKAAVVDLRNYGWTFEKAEGLSLVDSKTLVVSNDQDFGVVGSMTGDPASTDPTKYVVDSTGALTIGGVASAASYELHAQAAADQRSSLFVVRLVQPVSAALP